MHGLAFAGAILPCGLSPEMTAVTILCFNLGIELRQLIVVLAVVPSVILLSQTRFYPIVRNTGASLAILAAAFWIVARSISSSSARLAMAPASRAAGLHSSVL